MCKCGSENRPGQRTCWDCHAAYLRRWRSTHPMTPEARRRSNARSYAHTYRDRGLILSEPCGTCGSALLVEMHHDDYDRPTAVRWLCRRCHLAEHGCRMHRAPRGRLPLGLRTFYPWRDMTRRVA